MRPSLHIINAFPTLVWLRSLKYTQNVVADRGTQPQAYTAYRFKNEVLYVETDTERYGGLGAVRV